MLDRTAAALGSEGHDVRRGPADAAGTLRRYSRAEQAKYLNEADVAVFTTRHKVSRRVYYPVTGVDTLDVAAATDLGIIVGHGAVSENVVGMAEATLMLMLLYDAETNIARIKSRSWRRPATVSRQMAGKTVGLVGFGRIAREVSSRLVPFQVRLLTCSPRTPPERLPAGVSKVDLPTLRRESDVVALLTGLTEETRRMIGAEEFGIMKPDAWPVNTARGELGNEAALVEALRHKRIGGAALDTFATEPLPHDSPLRRLDNPYAPLRRPHGRGQRGDRAGAVGEHSANPAR